MTREEAIKIFNTVLLFGKCDCPKEEIEECLKMAIKALEQEPCVSEGVCREDKIQVLDKIRAEINSPNRGTCDYFIVDRIEEIIDKYKAESEG